MQGGHPEQSIHFGDFPGKNTLWGAVQWSMMASLGYSFNNWAGIEQFSFIS